MKNTTHTDSPEIAPIHWRQLYGRKSFYRLHPAMLGDGEYVRLLNVRPCPYSEYKANGYHQVAFDPHYAIAKLAFEIGECGEVPFLDLVELLGEAYSLINPDAPIIGLVSEIQKILDSRVKVDPVSWSSRF